MDTLASKLFDTSIPLCAKFVAWEQQNPKVYALFRKFALEMARTGRKRYSARTIIGRIRWHFDIETTGDTFKINDHWSPFYSRMFVHEFPEHAEFFEQRTANAGSPEVTA